MRHSLDKGRRTEREVARRLTRWAAGRWLFRRRGLGHAGVPDLVVEPGARGVPWPFAVSVKAGRGPTLGVMLVRAAAGLGWPWWQQVASVAGSERAWLVWKQPDGAWLLSCGALWGVIAANPPRAVGAFPPPMTLIASGWPPFTVPLDAFLKVVPPERVVEIARRLAKGG